MKILLMGGTGWLGHNIARQLLAEGENVTILTRGKKQTFANEMPQGIETIIADKSDEAAMAQILKAGYTHIIDTVPSVASINNVKKYACNLHHYIHCSSTGGYAPLPFVPCDETAPYGGFGTNSGWAQKRIVDNLVLNSFLEEGFPATVIRPCYITGPGMLPLDNLGGRRQDFIKDILDEKTLDLPNDGQALLQPIHVEDLATSFLLALANPCSKGQVYNICLSHAVHISTYVELNAAALGKKAHINLMPLEEMLEKYKADINETWLRFFACDMCFSIEKARCQLGYNPRHTPEDTIQETAIWAAKSQGLIS
ncbi:MAG: NAD-dependent epimerase/dehydratase family protein [Victivallales bacterium]|nr:NAD-dependent epimerase/dehydratase family protein [Victivallales bacterium]